jgi:hypothetical protein
MRMHAHTPACTRMHPHAHACLGAGALTCERTQAPAPLQAGLRGGHGMGWADQPQQMQSSNQSRKKATKRQRYTAMGQRGNGATGQQGKQAAGLRGNAQPRLQAAQVSAHQASTRRIRPHSRQCAAPPAWARRARRWRWSVCATRRTSAPASRPPRGQWRAGARWS